ncbi:protein-(glutamine-N5) methyltransferase, release factor-specific [Candidatus Peregrinibacteria bacterium RIFCSPLOWO2_01_FULL_39_12]|nr:MAG: protein-(glutamine-N5) methyltransferase, release factor-specific [Candidatus Peregrinibacteria bacterium RIFCSPLOWO2_01_FULL_39_12]
MIIRDVLKFAVEYLGKTENAVLDSEVVLGFVLGVDKEYLFAHGNEEVDGFLVNLFKKYLDRVKNGEPVSYITNSKEFYGLDFFVDKRVLVPRPETEMLVEEVLQFLKSNADAGKCFRVLDVGTGSGNIAIALAKNFDGQDVVALDVSESAIEVAKINIEQHSLEDKVQVYQSDLLDVIDDGENFDVIVANLPYIGRIKNNYVGGGVEKHEPGTALFGGNDGLKLYKKMFQQIADKRVGFKLLVGEFGFGQGKDLEILLSKYFDHGWRIKSDLAGIDRMFAVEG